jgi:hypothetical protein
VPPQAASPSPYIQPTALVPPASPEPAAAAPAWPQADGASAGALKLPVETEASPLSRLDTAALRVEADNPFAGLDETRLPEAFNAGGTLANVRGDASRYMLLRGFKMVNGSGGSAETTESLTAAEGIHSQLDGRTLAGLYEAQDLPHKALAVYDRLLREAPGDLALLARRNAVQVQRNGADRAAAQNGAKSSREEKILTLERLLARLEALP